MNIQFQPITDFPRGTLYALLSDAYAFDPRYEQRDHERWREEMDNFFYDNPRIADTCGFVTTLRGEPIGFASWDPRKRPASIEVGHNCIAAAHKGHGYGVLQMREAIRRITAQGTRTILVTTNSDLLPAQRMYTRAGFTLRQVRQQGDDLGFAHLDYILIPEDSAPPAITVRAYTPADLPAMTALWNDIVADGISFPQDTPLTPAQAEAFFAGQSYTGVADEDGAILGLYILHPNNVGRCGHIANASYAVQAGQRGKHIGERLVRDSMARAMALSFRILQFNAVVATNAGAIHLYEKLGFTRLGVIPGGFRLNDGTYADIIPFFIALDEATPEEALP